jgi:hypothetical protein
VVVARADLHQEQIMELEQQAEAGAIAKSNSQHGALLYKKVA